MQNSLYSPAEQLPATTYGRLGALVLLRQALRELLPHLSDELRQQVSRTLVATSHVQVDVRPPALPAPTLFGWAIRLADDNASNGAWYLEQDAARAQWCMAARDAAGSACYEVIGLSKVETTPTAGTKET